VPSQADVDRAQAAAAATARDVGAIKARMLLADQRLEAAALRAEQASEAYNGAMWRVEQAREEYRDARAEADRARRTVASQRDRIGALVAQSYQDGGDLSAVNAVMSAEGPEGVLDQYAAFQGASTSLQADYSRFAATDSLAGVFEKQAAHAKVEQVRLAEQAKQAQAAATAAAAAAQTEATAIAAEKDRLVRALATAQNISVSLARSRQVALEEIARRKAEERARRAAAAEAEARAAADAKARREAAQERRAARVAVRKARPTRRQPAPAAPRVVKRQRSTPAPAAAPAPAPRAPAPAPRAPAPTPAPPSSGGGAQRAIAFAKAQLGDPYVWGATGPGSWDCSGLTMAAWRAGGRSLPHYSVAQYESTTPISASDLRPGDLVFWSSNGSPSGIHHVALYIGGGQILHAPRTGRPVAIDSMYYWIPPNFFTRV
jgi:cell wall-associated NlpC family hydrolase